MLSMLIRAAKRFAVLIPTLAIAYVSIFNIFPWFNEHVPVVLAIIVTYVLGAYVFIPAIIRLARILFPPNHLPLYCVTPDGFASDPLNIGLIGTRKQLIAAMTQAGWHETDKLTFRTGLKTILSTIYDWDYPGAPISNLYLFGRKQDESFQIPIKNSNAGSRHHVRFWAASFQDGKRPSVRTIHWHNREAHLRDDVLLWVGAASRDIGVTFIRHSVQLTHLVDPDTDTERDLIVQQLRNASLAKLDRTIKLDEPYKLKNIRGWYGHLKTDGKMAIMTINR